MKKNIFLSLALLSSLGVTTVIAYSGGSAERGEIRYKPTMYYKEIIPHLGDRPNPLQPFIPPLIPPHIPQHNRPTNPLSTADQLKAAQKALKALTPSFEKLVTAEQRKILVLMANGNLAAFKKVVTPKTDITTPYGEYTLLMFASTVEIAQYLVEECKADINEAVFEPKYNGYVTALDCIQTRSPQTKVDKNIITYLIKKGAKNARQGLGLYSYVGDYVLSTQIQEIKNAINNVINLESQLFGSEQRKHTARQYDKKWTAHEKLYKGHTESYWANLQQKQEKRGGREDESNKIPYELSVIPMDDYNGGEGNNGAVNMPHGFDS